MGEKKHRRLRTATALKADAGLLSGAQSRTAAVAAAAEQPAAETGSVGELWLYGPVGGWWRGFDAESVAHALRGMDVETINVRIHSPGGLASDGIAIANLLRNHKAKIRTVVDGIAASAASVIAIAGDEVVMCPGSQLMIHDAAVGTWGNAAQLRRDADWIDGQSQNYAGVYALKAGGTVDEWRQKMTANEGDGTWYSADEAVTAGLADRVGVVTAAGSPPADSEADTVPDDEEVLARLEHDLVLLEQHVAPSALAAWQGQRASKPPTASAGGSTTTEGGSAVAFSTEQITNLRDILELPADADEAAIVDAVQAVVQENLEEHPPTGDAPAATAAVPPGHVVIPAAKLADLEAGAKAGTAAAKALHDKERAAFLDANRNKFLAANRSAWEDEYDRDPAAARAHFASAPVLIPDAELGHEVDADADEDGRDVLATVTESTTYKNWEF
ncbi:Clp protease ClpP [Nocardioides sp. TRM66260-LWL]|uniref:head maturation protease, ClpP-related n=1 Tax=Nocardioides sp. TRM66260-LWL TaxID=2874478 RepID=UPI001CC48B77|nr:head maturation protease, ClpP-related [Nocardioides sp. TRM66260-LWL]MBZ5736485.1 Clp protease ClpP [Nocardioides sp. TRM66260-LWL]